MSTAALSKRRQAATICRAGRNVNLKTTFLLYVPACSLVYHRRPGTEFGAAELEPRHFETGHPKLSRIEGSRKQLTKAHAQKFVTAAIPLVAPIRNNLRRFDVAIENPDLGFSGCKLAVFPGTFVLAHVPDFYCATKFTNHTCHSNAGSRVPDSSPNCGDNA